MEQMMVTSRLCCYAGPLNNCCMEDIQTNSPRSVPSTRGRREFDIYRGFATTHPPRAKIFVLGGEAFANPYEGFIFLLQYN